MSISPPYDAATEHEVEAVLHEGILNDHPVGVRTLRSALEVYRAVVGSLGDPPAEVLSDPTPSSEWVEPRTEPVITSRPVIPEQRIAAKCGHSDPVKGPCRRRPHPNAPKAHDYDYEVTTTTVDGPQHFRDALPA